ncbi:MAG: peptide transporter [Hyphomicrobiales bacterium]|nr:peptide transporter [Hyphomicrobiales bacterium]
MKKHIFLAGMAAFAASQSPALAASEQWLTRYAPPVSRTGPSAEAPRSDSAVTRPEAERARVVIKSLNAVVLVDSPRDVRKRGAKGSGVSGDAAIFPPSVKTVGERYIGKPMTLGDLDQLTRDIVLAFRAEDRPVVNVVVPEQEVTSGVLQVLVVVGRLSSVKVEGARPGDAAFFKREFRMPAGQPISEGALLDDLRYFNRNPFRNVTALYQPGAGYGQTEIALAVNQQKPWLVYGGVESKGDRGALGIYRPYVGAMAHNMLGLDEVVGYQFTTAKNVHALRSHVLSFTVPLMARLQLQATYGHTDTNSDLAAPLTQRGSSDVAGLYLTAPLPHWGRLSHDMRVGAEYKSTNNNLDYGGGKVTATNAVAAHAVIGYNGEWLSAFGVTRMDANAYYAPGKMFSGSDDAAFNALRGGAQARYAYARATVDHRLDFASGWRAVGVLTGQISSTSLLPTETLLMGGIGSVRGFTFGKQRADSGVVANLTVYTPALSLLGDKAPGFMDQLRLYGFVDHGSGKNHFETAVDKAKVNLTGAGLGLTYDVAPNASLDVGYGWRLSQTSATQKDKGAVHFRIVVRY